jgi:hypothetical protein
VHSVPVLIPESKSLQGTVSRLRGKIGQQLFQIAIMEYPTFPCPLFEPTFLGDSWPVVDFYVEVLNMPNAAYFFTQVKTTKDPIDTANGVLPVQLSEEDYGKLLRLPGPTYLAGVHEPSKTTYMLAIHDHPTRAVRGIPTKYILNPSNLVALRDEVLEYWKQVPVKPKGSAFS